MSQRLQARLEIVRRAVNEASTGLSKDEWKELLEEIAADVESYLDCIKEESTEAEP